MRRAKLAPDAFTYPSVLGACAGLGDAEAGRRVRDDVLELGFGSDLYVGNSLINMWSRLGRLAEARDVFDKMPVRDIVSWNSLIAGCSANGEWGESVEVYSELRMAGVVPDCFTVESVLLALGCLGAVEDGRVVHGLAYKIGVERDRLVSNSFIAMYCRCGELVEARRVFDAMLQGGVVSWNTMIDGYYESGYCKSALELFRDMVIASKPDLVTVTIILQACRDVEELKLGSSVHGYIFRSGYECDIAAFNSVIAMYSKCGRLCKARTVFDQMTYKDSVSCNLLIGGFVDQELLNEAIQLFKVMRNTDIKPDFVTTAKMLSICSQSLDSVLGQELHCHAIKAGFDSEVLVANALLNMYSKFGSLDKALEEFERIKTRDRISWSTIISGCVQNGNCILAFELLTRMKAEGEMLDVATILGILPACSFLAAKRHGKEIHGCIFKLGLEHVVPIGNALMDMYSRCGNLEYVVRTFGYLKIMDIVTWTTLISAYGMYGHGQKAIRSFKEMAETGILPDHVAFLAVLYACSHAGLVEDGKAYFRSMEEEYKITPRIEHYACMVDLLSRSGELIEAEKFITAMPLEPDISIWGALLNGCRINGETQIAEHAARKIMALNSDNIGYFVLVSNVYASIGKWDVVDDIRKSLRARKLRKDTGYSWIEIRKRMYVFGTGDQFVEQSQEIHQLLERLNALMARNGYVPDSRFVLQNVEEDDKRYILCAHSERLAIAFGLLNTKPGTPLQIMKNLRVCVDCHTATKYISKIFQRELLIRDANRFHLFKDGCCSCGDYW